MSHLIIGEKPPLSNYSISEESPPLIQTTQRKESTNLIQAVANPPLLQNSRRAEKRGPSLAERIALSTRSSLSHSSSEKKKTEEQQGKEPSQASSEKQETVYSTALTTTSWSDQSTRQKAYLLAQALASTVQDSPPSTEEATTSAYEKIKLKLENLEELSQEEVENLLKENPNFFYAFDDSFNILEFENDKELKDFVLAHTQNPDLLTSLLNIAIKMSKRDKDFHQLSGDEFFEANPDLAKELFKHTVYLFCKCPYLLYPLLIPNPDLLAWVTNSFNRLRIQGSENPTAVPWKW